LRQQRFEVELRVDNPNVLEVNLGALEFDLDLNGQSPASGLSTQPVILPRPGLPGIEARSHHRFGQAAQVALAGQLQTGRGYTLRGRAKLQGQDWLPYYFLPYLRYRHLFMRYTQISEDCFIEIHRCLQKTFGLRLSNSLETRAVSKFDPFAIPDKRAINNQ
jgi:hypothetical protein